MALAEDPPQAPATQRVCSIAGRVLDEDGQGLAAARVAWIGDAPGGDRSHAEPVRTDAEGAFRLAVRGPVDAEVRGTLWATHGERLSGVLVSRVSPGTDAVDEGALFVRNAQPLAVDVRRDGAPVAGAVVWAWTWTGNMYWGQTAFLGTATSDETGTASFGALPQGYYRLWARAPDGMQADAMRQVVVGHSTSRVRMNVMRPRHARVRVVNDADPAQGVAGVRVTRNIAFLLEDVVHSLYVDLPEPVPLTSSDGETVVTGLPADRGIELVVGAPGPVVRQRCTPGDPTTTIVVPAPLRIEVSAGELPVPPDGTRLTIHPRRSKEGVIDGWIEGGALRVPAREHALNPGVAIAPDGSMAPLSRADATSFYRPRALNLRILEAGGDGVATQVRLASAPYGQGPWDGPFATDAQGRIRIEGIPPGTYGVFAFPTARSPHGRKIADVDLTPGDSTQDLAVGKERLLRLRVSVDGASGIPSAPWWDLGEAMVVGAQVDRAASEIRLRVRTRAKPPASVSLRLGGRCVRSRDLTFAWTEGDEPIEIDAPLRSAPRVVAEVREDPDGGSDVYVEKWSPHSRSSWWASREAYPHLRGRTTLELEAGRYRLHDAVTGIVSEPFDVPELGGTVEAVIDLTNLVTIRGRIECPPAADCSKLEVGVEGEGIDSRFEFGGIASDRDGLPVKDTEFVLRVPAGRPVTLRACHPTLLPGREGGEVTLVGPRDDVVLTTGSGAMVSLWLADAEGRRLPADKHRTVRVVAVPSEHATRRPVIVTAEPAEGMGGHYRASGLPFGLMDLWVETSSKEHASAHRQRVRLLRDITDVGTALLTPGSRVFIRRVDGAPTEIALDPFQSGALGQFGSREYLSAERPRGRRDMLCQFEGLGAGRWHIYLGGTRTAPDGTQVPLPRRTFDIEVDGINDQTLDVDFSE
ncbi:MAG: hypothetical protein AB7T63_00390 [Planctomycetota bacterium]